MLRSKLQSEQKALEDLEVYKRRSKEQAKEVFKLEKALEIKDSQIESFMVVAQRQIKLLEGRVKELQQMPGP